MDKAKVASLFGKVSDRFNVDDPRDQQTLLALQTQKQGEDRIPDLARALVEEPPALG